MPRPPKLLGYTMDGLGGVSVSLNLETAVEGHGNGTRGPAIGWLTLNGIEGTPCPGALGVGIQPTGLRCPLRHQRRGWSFEGCPDSHLSRCGSGTPLHRDSLVPQLPGLFHVEHVRGDSWKSHRLS